MTIVDVIVVGAGISGLAASTVLKRAGMDVLVLERSTRPGGRIHSIQLNECVVEAGANFVTDAYRLVPELAGQVGLAWKVVRGHSAIARKGQLHSYRGDHPTSAIRSGLLTWADALGAVPGLVSFQLASLTRGTIDPLDWSSLDGRFADSWADRLGLATMLDRVWRPVFHGFYFQDTAATSAAAVAAMAAHGVRQKTLTLTDGLSSLPIRLAERLDVRYNTTVESVEEHDRTVTVTTNRGAFQAKRVILAVPGFALPTMTALTGLESAVAGTPYSLGLLVMLGITRRLHPDELANAYGVLAPPGDGLLASICVASRAGHAHGTGDVVTCLFAEPHSRTLAATPERAINAARSALLTWAPTLHDTFADTPNANRVVAIPHAMPMTAPGRLSAIAAYRQQPRRRVILAGDSIAWPWTDSAVFAGQWAAEQVVGA